MTEPISILSLPYPSLIRKNTHFLLFAGLTERVSHSSDSTWKTRARSHYLLRLIPIENFCARSIHFSHFSSSIMMKHCRLSTGERLVSKVLCYNRNRQHCQQMSLINFAQCSLCLLRLENSFFVSNKFAEKALL